MEEHSHYMDAPFSYLFRIISLKLKNKADKSISELDINSQQGRTIGFIDAHEGIIQRDLSEFFGLRDASTTSLLQGLERKGYIERRILKENEREKRLYLMPKGRELVTQVNEKFVDVEQEIRSHLTDEEAETLISLLTKLNSNL